MSDLPTIRLKPKAEARAIRHGFPWVYDNELVTDRRTKALAAGSVARLVDDAHQDLGLVCVNPASRIFGRMLDRDVTAVIDGDWIAQRLARAQDLRTRLYDAPFYRLVHAEGDGLPGVVIDRFGDAAVIQPNTAWADVNFDLIAGALRNVTGVTTIVRNGSSRARVLEGLAQDTTLHTGTLDGPVPVPMNGATYLADLMGGQKTGLFFDQRDNHAFAAKLASGARMLDVFAHVGGFALAALAGGASSALAVDSSAPALTLGRGGRQGKRHGGPLQHHAKAMRSPCWTR
jgi:23S rRNA (cytosine1962-C5)-methyltransferase